MPLTAFLSTPSRADMYGYDGQQDTQQLQCYNELEQWRFDANSTASDNGLTVIKPTSILLTDPGRWVFQYKMQSKKQETFSGISNSSGNFTVTFASAYPSSPDIQPAIINPTDTQTIRITAISTTGFTVNVRNRADVIGLLPTYSNVNGASVSVLVTQR